MDEDCAVVVNEAHLSKGKSSMAAGKDSEAGDRSIAIGFGAKVTGDESVLIGSNQTLSSNKAVVVGIGADAHSMGTAVGYKAEARGSAAAVGAYSQAKGVGSVALGGSAIVTTNGSIQVGNGFNNHTDTFQVFQGDLTVSKERNVCARNLFNRDVQDKTLNSIGVADMRPGNIIHLCSEHVDAKSVTAATVCRRFGLDEGSSYSWSFFVFAPMQVWVHTPNSTNVLEPGGHQAVLFLWEDDLLWYFL